MKKAAKSDKSFAESESNSFRLPPEALKFGKQLGIDFKGLEPEAQEIWRQLEYLSNNDPLEYQRFVAQQMQAAKEEEEEKKLAAQQKKPKEKAAAEEKPKNEGGYFRPEACFCVKVATVGGDGLKVREVGDEKLPELTLFVNMCASKIIDEPTDEAGRKVLDANIPVADGLQIPLVVGTLRKLDDSSNAIDVVFHPVIASLCAAQRYFRAQITDLALEWVRQEAKVQFEKNKWQDADATNTMKYKGGLGDNKDIPVLFHVSPEGETSQPLPGPAASANGTTSSIFPPSAPGGNNSTSAGSSGPTKVKKTGTATFSTESLLSSLRQEEEPAFSELSFSLPPAADITSTANGNKNAGIQPVDASTSAKKKFIIEEVGGSGNQTGVDSLADELEGEITVLRPSNANSGSNTSLLQEVKTSIKTSSGIQMVEASSTKTAAETATASSILKKDKDSKSEDNNSVKKKSVGFEGLRGKLADPATKTFVSTEKTEEKEAVWKPPNKETLEDLEKMMNRCDEEFACSALEEESDMSGLAASANILSDLAKAFSKSGDAGLSSILSDTLAQTRRFENQATSKPSSANNTANKTATPSTAATAAPTNASIEPSITVGISHPRIITASCTPKNENMYEIMIEGIKSTTNAADLVLEASSQMIKIKTDITSFNNCAENTGKALVEVQLKIPGKQVNTNAITAGFKKKQGKFIVTIATKGV